MKLAYMLNNYDVLRWIVDASVLIYQDDKLRMIEKP